MKIQDLFESGNPNNPGRAILSFEVFPPKRDLPIESIYGQLSSLCALKPDFISVTYGAGGKGNDNRTAEIAARIRHNYGVESVAHLTCVSNTKEDVDRITEELRMNNIENILALRMRRRLRSRQRPHRLPDRTGRVRHRRRLLPGGPPRVRERSRRHPEPQKESRRGRVSPHHPALFRQRDVLPVPG